jgi:Ca2+-binding RTX toxin-like protein
VAANHLTAKGGSGEFWQFDQTLETGDPANAGWAKRSQQAQDVYTMLDLISSGNPNAGIVSGGDYNDFYFYRPLTTLTGYTMADGTARVGGARFDNLTLTLPEAERYTYTFDGRSQAIDHIIANTLLSQFASYDVVHLNTGFNPTGSPALSDHDPGLASFNFRGLSEDLVGTAGVDIINGYGGADMILGLGSNDVLDGGDGDDQLFGGTGDDTYYVDTLSDFVGENVGEGTDRIATSVSYALATGSEVEILEFVNSTSTATVALVGNEFANRIIGNAGMNYFFGGGAADTLIGLGGNDTYYVDAGDIIEEAVGGGTDRVAAAVSYALNAGAEVETIEAINLSDTTALNLAGNEFVNRIIGNNGANALTGGGGADFLVGLGGNDTYYVDTGDTIDEVVGGGTDRVAATTSFTLNAGANVELLEAVNSSATTALNLTGNELAQQVAGNAGANVIDGGSGNDLLTGYGGADIFAFTTALSESSNVDNIEDFVAGTDKIGLSHLYFDDVGSMGSFSANAFFAGVGAHDADDRIIYDSATGRLYYDADGVGGTAQVLFATLLGAPTLTASDFQVI